MVKPKIDTSTGARPTEVRAPLRPSEHVNWNESQALWWYDRHNEIAGFHRIAHQPNRSNAHIWHCLMARSGASFRRVATALPYEAGMRVEDVYRAELLSLRHDGRGGIEIGGSYPDAKVELVFNDLHESLETYILAGFKGSYVEGKELTEAHFEAAGAVKGAIELAGKRYAIDALGYRDHSWGPRKPGDVQITNWLTGTLGPNLSFMVSKFILRNQPVAMLGYILDRGEVQVIDQADITYVLEFDGVSIREARAKVRIKTGRTYELRFYDPFKAPVVHIEGWIATETVYRLDFDGRPGVGLTERSFNICSGAQPPSYTVGALTEQGLVVAP
jgi:hypothetical protein